MSNAIDMDFLGEVTLDDLAVFAGNVIFLAGTHDAVVNFAAKKIGDAQAIEASFTLENTVSLNDPSKTPQAPGTVATALFNMDKDGGQASLNALLTPLAESLGTRSVRTMLDKLQGASVRILSTEREYTKNDGTQAVSMNIKSMILR